MHCSPSHSRQGKAATTSGLRGSHLPPEGVPQEALLRIRSLLLRQSTVSIMIGSIVFFNLSFSCLVTRHSDDHCRGRCLRRI